MHALHEVQHDSPTDGTAKSSGKSQGPFIATINIKQNKVEVPFVPQGNELVLIAVSIDNPNYEATKFQALAKAVIDRFKKQKETHVYVVVGDSLQASSLLISEFSYPNKEIFLPQNEKELNTLLEVRDGDKPGYRKQAFDRAVQKGQIWIESCRFKPKAGSKQEPGGLTMLEDHFGKDFYHLVKWSELASKNDGFTKEKEMLKTLKEKDITSQDNYILALQDFTHPFGKKQLITEVDAGETNNHISMKFAEDRSRDYLDEDVAGLANTIFNLDREHNKNIFFAYPFPNGDPRGAPTLELVEKVYTQKQLDAEVPAAQVRRIIKPHIHLNPLKYKATSSKNIALTQGRVADVMPESHVHKPLLPPTLIATELAVPGIGSAPAAIDSDKLSAEPMSVSGSTTNSGESSPENASSRETTPPGTSPSEVAALSKREVSRREVHSAPVVPSQLGQPPGRVRSRSASPPKPQVPEAKGEYLPANNSSSAPSKQYPQGSFFGVDTQKYRETGKACGTALKGVDPKKLFIQLLAFEDGFKEGAQQVDQTAVQQHRP